MGLVSEKVDLANISEVQGHDTGICMPGRGLTEAGHSVMGVADLRSLALTASRERAYTVVSTRGSNLGVYLRILVTRNAYFTLLLSSSILFLFHDTVLSYKL